MSPCCEQSLTGWKILNLCLKNCIQCFPFQILLCNYTNHWHSQNSIVLLELIGSIDYLGLFHSDKLQACIVFWVFQEKTHCVHSKTISRWLCPYGDNNPSPACQRRWLRDLNEIIRCEIIRKILGNIQSQGLVINIKMLNYNMFLLFLIML